MPKLQTSDAERRQARPGGRDQSEALVRGLAVLTTFDAARREQTLSELANRIGLPRATVRRTLLTLVALGYMTQDGRRFRLTPGVLRLAATYLTSNGLSVLLQPVCDRVSAAVDEACTAAVLHDDEAVMVAHAAPSRLSGSGAGIGFRLPAYGSALGRVLLSGLPKAALDGYLQRTALRPLTPQTRTGRADVLAAVEAVRRDGYAFVDGEAESGFRSVAVPLRRFDGSVAAALNVGARVERADAARMTGPLLAAVLAEAERLTLV